MNKRRIFLIVIFLLGCSLGCSFLTSASSTSSSSSPSATSSHPSASSSASSSSTTTSSSSSSSSSPSLLSPLISNADFTLDQNHDNLPDSWYHGDPNLPDLEPSRFGWEQFPGSSSKAIWIIGGQDREGEWCCRIEDITPNTDYILHFYAYRDTFINKIYPEVEIFNQCILLDNHCTQGGWQLFELHLNSKDAYPVTTLKFRNRFPVRFWFYLPELVPASEYPPLLSDEEQRVVKRRMEFISNQKHFFPIGIYGISSPRSLVEIKKAGFNTALIPPNEEFVKIASDMGIKVIVNICPWMHDPNSGSLFITGMAASPSLLSWYIADEPEISPLIPEVFLPIVKKLNRLDPVHPTCIAMNRAWLVSNYEMVNNLFLLDEYPIPNMPLTWFTESLDQARNVIGSQRLWSIVQAFGGPKHKDAGWPRFPTYQELRALTYLSIIHHTTGILYFSYSEAFASQTNWANLGRVVSELNFLYPWLTIPNCTQGKNGNEPDLKLRMLRPYKADAEGKPAIHFAFKKEGDRFLLLAVNTLDHPVEMSLDGLPQKPRLLNVLFENRKIVVKEGNLQDEFDPFETHIYANF
ncbi:MAG: hypothetical protein AB1847_06255 [bacterium]